MKPPPHKILVNHSLRNDAKQVFSCDYVMRQRGIMQYDEKRPAAVLRQVQSDREQAACKRFISDGLTPQAITIGGACQAPSAIPKSEHLRAVCEHLDITVGCENHAYVAAAYSGKAVELVAGRYRRGKFIAAERP